jgi:hypothetical protein
MEEKLRKLMKHEGINSTKLAEMLGIQASGISHIMSGRNKPSYDFIVKLLNRFPQINPDWLLIDKGPMYRGEIKSKASLTTQGASPAQVGSSGSSYSSGLAVPAAGFSDGLFSAAAAGSLGANGVANETRGSIGATRGPATASPQSLDRDDRDIIPATVSSTETQHPAGASPLGMPRLAPASSIERIVVFYRDKTFTEYQPGNKD